MCWFHYKLGAGFEVNQYIHDFFDELALVIWFGICLWPATMMVHISTNIYNKFNLSSIVKIISPNSFYERGEYDNDLDIQAEKHLLGKK